MMRKTRSFREMHDDMHGLAAPSAPGRVAMEVAGNPDVIAEASEGSVSAPKECKAGGRTVARQQLAKRGLKLEGASPAIRADRPSRRARGGRDKHQGVGHLLIIGLPHSNMMGAPMARHRDASPKGEHRHERHGAPGAGSYKRGGVVEADHRREV
jgi:hypothetical protein